jgi:cardiolipin synthase A/B
MKPKNRAAPDAIKAVVTTMFRLLPLAACACLAACGNVPLGERFIDQVSPLAGPPIITTSHAALTPQQSEEIFRSAGIPDYWMHHLSVEQAINPEPLTDGNITKLLVDGDNSFDAVFDAISAARSSVDMEFYIFEDVRQDGTSLGDLLLRKRREGIAINIIFDSYGSAGTPPEFFERLGKAGVKFVRFNPVDPLRAKRRYAPNNRDHRKILIVDGVTAITGGINLSTTYESSGSGRRDDDDNPAGSYWHDADIEIHGPAVGELQHLFFQHWQGQKGPEPDKKDYFPQPQDRGNELIRVIGSKPGPGSFHYYATLLSALKTARSHIWLTASYFVPTDEQLHALMDAKARGVDVRILVPQKSDSSLALVMQRALYADLLKDGIKIYEAHNEVLHSKSVVIDGVWSVMGSSNFDHRSVVFNDEADVVMLGATGGAKLEKLFEADCAKAQQVTPDKWKHRPYLERVKENLAPLWLAIVKPNL